MCQAMWLFYSAEYSQLLAKEYVVRSLVSVQQLDLCLVVLVFADRPDQLIHGRNTSSSADHAQVTAHISSILHGAFRTAKFDLLQRSSVPNLPYVRMPLSTHFIPNFELA